MSETPSTSAAIDRDNPWPGLASFTEDARGFFFGREKETEELTRLVKRQTLTVLFGQSGLGKSSLLQAGLFPLLREADFLPLYLRLDHSIEVARASRPWSGSGMAVPAMNEHGQDARATLADQVKAALTAAFAAAKADAPAFSADETLWEYFHRKDVDIWSAKNRLLTPVLAFDQFEEIFTLGRASDTARERSRAFLAELACLVENRAPAAVQTKLDAGTLDPARFNFTKPSCQVILSLREDFLPDLEGLKQEMPALVHNRLRLKKLNGTQALEIVSRPAPQLLADGVAEKIVEFVAGARGGSAERLAELDIEPPLLSVICRELNDRRRSLDQTQITADLVSGNRREILTDFYERSVTDLPEAMRRFVEDKLLTKSGYRDNLALETALEFPGVTRPLLDLLVARRLVRIEDRLGTQRVELTHDVLAEVIRASRAVRQERESKEAVERQLAATQTHELATRRALWRARWVAAICGFVAVAAVGSAVFGYLSRRRAVAAERQALEAAADAAKTRQLAEAARGEAEKLITFLVDDLWRDLHPFGRFEIARKLAQSAVDYYKQLPADLRTPATERNRALALARLGAVLDAQNNTEEAGPIIDEAVRILEAMHRQGDNAIDTITGLALALELQGRLFSNQGGQDAAAVARSEQAVALLRGPASAPDAPRRLQNDFGHALHRLGFDLSFRPRDRQRAGDTYREAGEVFSRLRASDPTDHRALFGAGMILTRLGALANLQGQPAEGRKLAEEAIAVFEQVLEQQPANVLAINFRGIAHSTLTGAYNEMGQLNQAVATNRLAARDYETAARHNPTHTVFWGNLILTKNGIAARLARMGRLGESAGELRAALALEQKTVGGGRVARMLAASASQLAIVESGLGHTVAAEKAQAEFKRLDALGVKDMPTESPARLDQPERDARLNRALLWQARGRETEIYAAVREAVLRLDRRGQEVENDDSDRGLGLAERLSDIARRDLAESALRLGKFMEAETVAREAANSLTLQGAARLEQKFSLVRIRLVEALAMARQGRNPESLALVEPLVALSREFAQNYPEDASVGPTLAEALFVQAVAQPPEARERRRTLLEEAQRLMADVKGETAGLWENQELREWIAQELGK